MSKTLICGFLVVFLSIVIGVFGLTKFFIPLTGVECPLFMFGVCVIVIECDGVPSEQVSKG